MDPPKEAVIYWTRDAIEEAQTLVYGGHPEMGVVRAYSAVEVFLRQVLLEPYLQESVFKGFPELADKAVAFFADSRWKDKFPWLAKACWGIEVKKLPEWRDISGVADIRNEIIHGGSVLPQREALEAVGLCSKFLEIIVEAHASAPHRKESASEPA